MARSLREWLDSTQIYERLQFSPDEEELGNIKTIIEQFTMKNFIFAKKANFGQEKIGIFLEIMHYILRQLIDSAGLSEDESYENFKTLLLRHAVHRPPHSLAFLTLEDVKSIDLFVQDSFFRHFDMYKFVLTVKDELVLAQQDFFTQKALPQTSTVAEGSKINFQEVKELQEFFSPEEQEAIQKE